MIFVTQGHEKGIGTEVFLKSFLMLSKADQSKIIFICSAETLKSNAKKLSLGCFVSKDHALIESSKLNCHFIKHDKHSQTMNSMLYALNSIKENDILLTLPSSKDQFQYDKINHLGHTEFFRHYFKVKSLAMGFLSPALNILLVSDHIPLANVTKITDHEIFEKTKIALEFYPTYFKSRLSNCYFAGFNPHAGEKGLLGSEETQINNAIAKLKNDFSAVTFEGPLPADTLHFHFKKQSSLFVYLYHDQALAVFKALSGPFGVNVTYGLPFLRISVDHGTAFDIFGMNKANYQSCLFSLKLCLRALK